MPIIFTIIKLGVKLPSFFPTFIIYNFKIIEIPVVYFCVIKKNPNE